MTAAEARGLRGSAPALRAKDLAVKHKDVIEAIRLKLEERGVSLPTSHFADADVELARYAVTVGLLTAHTAAERYFILLLGLLQVFFYRACQEGRAQFSTL